MSLAADELAPLMAVAPQLLRPKRRVGLAIGARQPHLMLPGIGVLDGQPVLPSVGDQGVDGG